MVVCKADTMLRPRDLLYRDQWPGTRALVGKVLGSVMQWMQWKWAAKLANSMTEHYAAPSFQGDARNHLHHH